MGHFFASLNWLFVDKGPVEDYRRSLAMFLVNMVEVGLYFSIVDFLWTSPGFHSSVWFTVKCNIYTVFQLEQIVGLKDTNLLVSLADIQIVISWFLYAVILANVVGGIRRTQKNKK